jgi:hypothetical protein
MKASKLPGVLLALLWAPCVFAQLTIIQDKNGHSKLALKLPESNIIPAASLVKKVSLGNSFRKPEPVHLDLEGQFQQLKEKCLLSQAIKSSLQLTGERHTTALVGLEWETVNGLNNYQFEVERSLGDTMHFEVVNHVWAKNFSGFKDTYRLPDGNGYDEVSYYRLRVILRTGDYVYSNIAAVKGYDTHSFFVYPNPALSNVTINFLAKEQGEAIVKIYDAAGKLVAQETIGIGKGTNQKSINVSRLVRGSYTVQLKVAGQSYEVSKFIKG